MNQKAEGKISFAQLLQIVSFFMSMAVFTVWLSFKFGNPGSESLISVELFYIGFGR